MSKRPLVPSFLQKLDDKLLRNKPGAWATRVHLVIYFVAAFALLLFVFCYAVFFDAKQYSRIESWNVFVGLIAFIGFVFWLIFCCALMFLSVMVTGRPWMVCGILLCILSVLVPW
ncbi:MAG: hypothetical protein IPF72_01590 [Chitinophagaceae bacterium]|nr:hypothetical protein [Chitinophagaceae bacterium]